MCIHSNTWIHIWIYTYTYTQRDIWTHIYIHIFTYTYEYTYMHTHMYIYLFNVLINPPAHTWSQYCLNSAESFLSMAEWRTDCMSIGDFLNQCIAVALNIRSTPRETRKKTENTEKFGWRNRVINCVVPGLILKDELTQLGVS